LLIFGAIAVHPEEHDQWETWVVKDKLNCEKGGSIIDASKIKLSVSPPTNEVNGDGTFSIKIPVERYPNGYRNFPILRLEHPDFMQVTVPLENEKSSYGQIQRDLTKDTGTKMIRVNADISFKKNNPAEAYNPNRVQVAKEIQPTVQEVAP
jgi:hypothetical protein